jgi:RecB family exonuclease
VSTVIFRSPSGALRQERALRELERIGPSTEACLVGATSESADEIARVVTAKSGASFGWHRLTLRRLAGVLAAPVLAARGISTASGLSLEALCVRLVRHVMRGKLGRFETLADRPGLPRALAKTIDELRLADKSAVPDPDLEALLAAYDAELAALALADGALVLQTATEIVREASHPLLGCPLVLYDLPVTSMRERAFISALASRAKSVLATVPSGDDLALQHLAAALPNAQNEALEPPADSALGRLARSLFAESSGSGGSSGEIAVLSAPGESRECVEIARAILREAGKGTPFDRMAILLRAPQHYRAGLEEALRRAGVPACFASGTIRPDPTGRALLSLLACTAEGLSARRFAEYMSLGELPAETEEGSPPSALPYAERYHPPDEELAPASVVFRTAAELPVPPIQEGDPDEDIVVAGSLRAPRLWEKLVIDAAVIGGLDRWQKRLDALERERLSDLKQAEDPDGADAMRLRRELRGLDALRTYALPLIRDLAALPTEASWSNWIEKLTALATRAIARPERVLSVLAELHPMGNVEAVTLADVRLALERRLTELPEPPPSRRYGHVYVSSIAQARGLVFDVVFVPGLAERLFPQKVGEDPLLLDRLREKMGGLRLMADRTIEERLMLRLAVGSARKGVILSYPRLDIEHGRPRTPSFYGLEVLRAAEGKLPGFGELADRAQRAGAARIGWPALPAPQDAIDDAEHDLALLEPLMTIPEQDAQGRARYLLAANPHLARALKFRGRRWMVRRWHPEDGLVDPTGAARDALLAHALKNRTFSPTALQNFAACPYRFFLYAVHRLAPSEEPAALEELDPLQRGSLVHQVQFELYRVLRDKGLLPVRDHNLKDALALLDDEVDAIAAEYKERLAPAIERVWDDGIAQIKSDLRELLRRMAQDVSWTPSQFELSFGLVDKRGRDAASRDEGAPLDCGIKLRGSIDLVEKSSSGEIRVTDYKTGKQQAKDRLVIQGGKILQPVLYALAVEKMQGREVHWGRLYYCTSTGGFKPVDVEIDAEARDAATLLAQTIGGAIENGFLPAAPEKDACRWCDYRPVCGPYEEARTAKKMRDRLEPLVKLRNAR